MKKAPYYLFSVFIVSVMFLCKPRQDTILGAINESQSIKLFEEDSEFELRVKDNNLYTGIYTISKDTIFLEYQEHLEVSATSLFVGQTEDHMNLPSKLHICDNASQICSCQDTLFSAEIYLDKRQEFNEPAPLNFTALSSHTDLLTSLGIDSPLVLLQR